MPCYDKHKHLISIPKYLVNLFICQFTFFGEYNL